MRKVLKYQSLRQMHHLFDQGTATGLSDAQLLERFASDRDESAFGMLVARHGPVVFRVCLRVLHDPHDAEDVFQATFLVLARHAGSIWVRDSLASWLYRIAIRLAVQAKTDTARRRRHEQQAAGDQMWQQGVPSPLEPDIISTLCQEIDRLPEKYRAPVVLCHLEELTHEAAAQVLRCPVGTVHGRLSRARELLRRRLTRRGVALPAGVIAAMLAGSGSHALAAAVPAPLCDATLRAATNLAAGQGIASATGSATVGALVTAALRTMTLRAFKSAAVAALMVIAAVGASVLVGKGLAGMLTTSEEPTQPAAVSNPHADRSGLLHSTFDGGYGQNLTGGRKRPLFVDLDTGRFMEPPFALEPADVHRPLVLPNLAFPQKLKDWIRFQGVDAAVQIDGQIIILMGLEMEVGEHMPLSAMWSSTVADALERINRVRVRRLRREGLNDWPSCVDALKQQDPTQNGTHDLPFLTREGCIGILSFRIDHQDLRRADGIRLDCRLERGLELRFEGGLRFGSVRRTPEPPILGMFAGPLIIALQDGKIILKQSGGLERIEIGQGKVVLRAGQTETADLLLEAARLATFVMDLDGRRDQVEIFGWNKSVVLRRDGNLLRVGADGRTLECERMTLGLPGLTISSVKPDVPDEHKAP